MPVHVEKRGNKYRVCDPNGDIAKNQAGTPVDGGGHSNIEMATKQVNAINLNRKNKNL